MQGVNLHEKVEVQSKKIKHTLEVGNFVRVDESGPKIAELKEIWEVYANSELPLKNGEIVHLQVGNYAKVKVSSFSANLKKSGSIPPMTSRNGI